MINTNTEDFTCTLDELVSQFSNNPWKDTPWEDYYNLNPRRKGSVGEAIVCTILKNSGKHDVKARTSAGHDAIIDGKKTEIKFSLATDRNSENEFMINHVGFDKDWDEFIFCGVNGDFQLRMIRFTKENFPKELFSHQQGGNKSNNDDFFCNGTKSTQFMFHKNAEELCI